MSVRAVVVIGFVASFVLLSFSKTQDDAVPTRPQAALTLRVPLQTELQVNATHESEARHADLSRYSLLLDTTPIGIRERLRTLLSRRESVPTDDLVAASESERALSLLLCDDDYALYERLRYANVAYEHVLAYGTALARHESLTPVQMRRLLLARAQYADARTGFELRASAAAELPAMEREYAQDIADHALASAQSQYRDDAQAVLTERQWLALVEFEGER